MKRFYPAIIEKDENPGYSVFFPDVLGCTSVGDTIEETHAGAGEALALHLKTLVDSGADIPEPSAIEDLEIDQDIEVAVIIMVEAALPGKKKRYNVTLDEMVVERIDAETGNRSAFLEAAAVEKLEKIGR